MRPISVSVARLLSGLDVTRGRDCECFQVFALNEHGEVTAKVANLCEMRPIFFSGGGAPAILTPRRSARSMPPLPVLPASAQSKIVSSKILCRRLKRTSKNLVGLTIASARGSILGAVDQIDLCRLAIVCRFSG